MIRESQKRKKDVASELYFVPFDRVHVGEFVPMKFYMEDKEVKIIKKACECCTFDFQTPLPFHYLDALETQGLSSICSLCLFASERKRCLGGHTLEPYDHILCVYGDNFFNAVKYKLIFLPLDENCQQVIESLRSLGPALSDKKREMTTFQREYMEAKKK